jgi:hypothetical protein
MEFYNSYISGLRHDYVSEIAIVNTHQSIIERRVFFVNFNKILNVSLTTPYRYLNYDKTYFTNNSIYCTDYNFLNKEIFFKQLDINSLVRKEKLKNINEN